MTEIYETTYEVFLLRTIFNICLIISLIIFGIYLFFKIRGLEPGSPQKRIFLGYFLFLLCYGLVRVFFVLSDNEVYYQKTIETVLNDLYVGLAYTVGFIGFLCMFFMIERYLIHTRYIFTVFGIVLLILSIISIFPILPTEVPQMIVLIASPVFLLTILLLYIYVAIKSSGEARRRAFGIVTGLLVMVIGGLVFGSKLVGGALEPLGLIYEIRIIVEPPTIIIGAIIFAISQR